MKAKKYQLGGANAPQNSMQARKMATASAAQAMGDTFRDPEHGEKSMPLAAEVNRKQTGTTAMGDPFTAQNAVQTGYQQQIVGYETVFDETTGEAIGQTAIYGDSSIPTFDYEDATGAGVTIGGEDPFVQSGAQGMQLQGDRATSPAPTKPNTSMEAFNAGQFSVMDPVDFVRMLRDNRSSGKAAPKKK